MALFCLTLSLRAGTVLVSSFGPIASQISLYLCAYRECDGAISILSWSRKPANEISWGFDSNLLLGCVGIFLVECPLPVQSI